jgi:hypothetical protein
MNSSALSDMNEKKNVLLAQMESADEELFLLRKTYKEPKEVLPAVKIIKLRKSEEGFNRKLLHQYRDSKIIRYHYFTAVLFHNFIME